MKPPLGRRPIGLPMLGEYWRTFFDKGVQKILRDNRAKIRVARPDARSDFHAVHLTFSIFFTMTDPDTQTSKQFASNAAELVALQQKLGRVGARLAGAIADAKDQRDSRKSRVLREAAAEKSNLTIRAVARRTCEELKYVQDVLSEERARQNEILNLYEHFLDSYGDGTGVISEIAPGPKIAGGLGRAEPVAFDPLRILVAMVGVMDRESGCVYISLDELRRRAGVTREHCQRALEFLEGEYYSAAMRHSGRRIERIAGGWRIHL